MRPGRGRDLWWGLEFGGGGGRLWAYKLVSTTLSYELTTTPAETKKTHTELPTGPAAPPSTN